MREVGEDSEGRVDGDADTGGDTDAGEDAGDDETGGGADGGDDPGGRSDEGPADAAIPEAPPANDGVAPADDAELTPPDDAEGNPATDAERTGEAASGFAVPTETESDRGTAWRRTLAEAGELTAGAVDALVSLHGGRGVRAVEAVSEGRVKRYRDFTVVVGFEDEYVVEDGGCTCKDSSYNLDPAEDDQRCWHVLAAAVAERIGEVDHHDMWYSDVREFL